MGKEQVRDGLVMEGFLVVVGGKGEVRDRYGRGTGCLNTKGL